VKEIFAPGDCLKRIASQSKRDNLENLALELILMLSSEANVDFNFFGIHGSIALGMHSNLSDIDIVIYGAENFRKVERAIEKLVGSGELKYVFTNKLDEIKRHKGDLQRESLRL
jgi:predicted nucleotidyltransferase